MTKIIKDCHLLLQLWNIFQSVLLFLCQFIKNQPYKKYKNIFTILSEDFHIGILHIFNSIIPMAQFYNVVTLVTSAKIFKWFAQGYDCLSKLKDRPQIFPFYYFKAIAVYRSPTITSMSWGFFDATTLSITTLSITTLSIKIFSITIATPNIMALETECCYSHCHLC
jgi:hypothetical protein